MDFLDLMFQFLADPKKLKDTQFRDRFIRELRIFYNLLSWHILNYLDEANQIDNRRHNTQGGPIDVVYGIEKSVFENFFITLYEFLNDSENEDIYRDFESVFGQYISFSLNFFYDTLENIESIKESIDITNAENSIKTPKRYAMIFHHILRFRWFQQSVEEITGTDNFAYRNIAHFFTPIVSEQTVRDLQNFLRSLRRIFPQHGHNNEYRKNVSIALQYISSIVEGGPFDLLIDAYRDTTNYAESLERRFERIILELDDFRHRFIDKYKSDSFLKGLIDAGEISGRYNDKDYSPRSERSSTKNCSETIVKDFQSDIEIVEMEAAETDPLEKLQKDNEKAIKQAHEKAQEKINKLKKNAQLFVFPKQQFVYNPVEETSINDIYSQAISNKVTQNTISFLMIPIKVTSQHQLLYFLKGSQQTPSSIISLYSGTVGQATSVDYMGRVRLSSGGTYNKISHLKPKLGSNNLIQIKSFLKNKIGKSTGQGRIIKGPGYSKQTSQMNNGATILKGPGYVTPLPIAGQVAGGYITVFIVIPQLSRNAITIASPKTKIKEKTSAAVDLGVMGVSMWAFTKFVANKHPKTAAGIMVGTAGLHAYNHLIPHVNKLANGQTGQTLHFKDKASYLKSNPFCTDGRKIIFLESNSEPLPKFSPHH